MPGFAQFSLPVDVAYLEPVAHTTGDLDGDGFVDMVGYKTWHRNLGDGTFAAPVEIIPEAGLRRTFVLDVNADGLPDLVVPLDDGRIVAHMNLGGTFDQTQEDIAYFFSGTGNISSDLLKQIYLVDIDNDGDQDLIVSFSTSSSIWCFNNDGANVYGPKRNLTTSLVGLFDEMITDLNGDGFPDLVYAEDNSGYDNLVVRMNLGTGSFGPIQVISNEQNQAQFFEARDLTSDGIPDLVLTKYGARQLVLMPGIGDGTFGAEQVLANNIPRSFQFAMVDMNNDGVEDALLGSPVDSVIVYYPGMVGGSFGAQVLISKNHVDLVYMEPFDMDNDGANDVMAVGSLLITHRNLSAGTSWESTIQSMRAGFDQMVLADMDQDGDDDLVTGYSGANRAIVWHPKEGDGYLRPKLAVAGIADLKQFRAADLDGDGRMDLIYRTQYDQSLSWARNLGAGVFDEPVLLASPNLMSQFNVGDLDNDGDVDILYRRQQYSWSALECAVAVNDGSGNFTIQLVPSLPNSLSFIWLRDMDGDGLLDVYTTSLAQFLWHRNDGGLTFTAMPVISHGTGDVVADFFDVDADGSDDLILGGDALAWHRNLGDGNYDVPQLILEGAAHTCAHTDVDSDGLVDLVSEADGQGLYWFRNLGGLLDPTPNLIITGGEFHFNWSSTNRDEEVLITDLDGNGREDFLFYYRPDSVEAITVVVYNLSGQVMLSGRSYVDVDADGTYSTGDIPAPWLPVAINPTPSVPHTAANGMYQYYAYEGNYNLTLGGDWPTPLWNVTVGGSGYEVEVIDTPITDLDFALSPAIDSSLVEVSVVLGTAPCGSPNVLWVSYRNMGTRIEHGSVSLVLDSLFEYTSSNSAPISIIGDSITWEFDALGYFEVRTIRVAVQMPGVQHLGLPYTLSGAVVTVDDNGAFAAQFNASLSDTVTCAYDPNDKQVEPLGFGQYGAIDVDTEELTYTIRFQNTGTAAAQDVELRDELPAFVDPQQLRVLSYSHAPTSFGVNEQNMLVVRFEGIQLPDSGASMVESQGFIRFGTQLLEGTHLDVVENTADIYFDNNPPVITNTTLNTLVDCGLWMPEATQHIDGQIVASAGLFYQWYRNGEELLGATEQTLEITSVGNYYAVVTSLYGCVANTDVVQVITLGMAEHGPSLATVFPDPFTVNFRVRMAGGSSIQDVELLDQLGRSVRRIRGEGSELVVERGDLPAGIYLLRVRSMESGIAVFRVAAE